MYADKITDSMAAAIRLTNERREKQKAYNDEHGITPQSIMKAVHERLSQGLEDEEGALSISEADATYTIIPADLPKEELNRTIKELERQMKKAAELFEFEKAAQLRDQIKEMREAQLLQNNNGKPVRAWEKYR
jgi:excinuclease ABC subunit B